MTRQKTGHSLTTGSNYYPLMHSDSVPDLTGGFVNENSGISTNHSTPQRIPMLQQNKQHLLNNNSSRYSANAGVGYAMRQNSSYSSGVCGTPLRQHQIQQQQQQKQQQQQFVNKFVDGDEDEFDGDYVDGGEVQLRRGNAGGVGVGGGCGQRRCDNDKDEWMYRRPLGPHDMRHSRKHVLNVKLYFY